MIGELKSDRAEVLEVMKKMEDHFHYFNKGWLSQDMITPRTIYGCVCKFSNLPLSYGQCPPRM